MIKIDRKLSDSVLVAIEVRIEELTKLRRPKESLCAKQLADLLIAANQIRASLNLPDYHPLSGTREARAIEVAPDRHFSYGAVHPTNL